MLDICRVDDDEAVRQMGAKLDSEYRDVHDGR